MRALRTISSSQTKSAATTSTSPMSEAAKPPASAAAAAPKPEMNRAAWPPAPPSTAAESASVRSRSLIETTIVAAMPRYREAKVAGEAARGRGEVAGEEPLDDGQEHEPEEQHAGDVADQGERRPGAGEPHGVESWSSGGEEKVDDAGDEVGHRARTHLAMPSATLSKAKPAAAQGVRDDAVAGKVGGRRTGGYDQPGGHEHNDDGQAGGSEPCHRAVP